MYEILSNKYENIEIHVEYAKIFNNHTTLISDFKVGKNIIEVTSFKKHNHKLYYEKLKRKQKIVESNGYYFHIVTSLAEAKQLALEV